MGAMTPPADLTDPTSSDPLSAETRAHQREALAAHRNRPDRRSQGLVIVHTGDGKGKTTAALGLLLRAWGQGLRVAMFQFIKAKSGNWGESRAALKMGSGAYDVVVLDELTYCFTFGWLDVEEVLSVLRCRPAGQHVVITGRDATQELIDFADLVTEMRAIKHPYDAGIKAQKGIEF
jgi:cob(I)alamin adenosyltransferase